MEICDMKTQGHSAPISGISSYSGKFIITAGYDNRLILWDDNFNVLATAEHEHLVNQAVFSPCGEYIASCSSDYSVRLWNKRDLSEVIKFTAHEDDVEMVKFSPSGKLLASCSRDTTVAIYDLEKSQLLFKLIGHEADVLSVDWVNEYVILTCGDDSTVRYWDIRQQKEISKLYFDGIETDTLAIISSEVIAAGNDDGVINILVNGNVSQTVKAHDSGVKRLVYNPATSQLISISYDRNMAFWMFLDGEVTFSHEVALPAYVWPRSCCFIRNDLIGFGTFTSHYTAYDMNEHTWKNANFEWSRSLNALAVSEGDTYVIGDAGSLIKNGQSLVTVNSLCNFVLLKKEDNVGNKLYFGGQEGKVWRFCEQSKQLSVLFEHVAPLNCAVLYQNNYLMVGDYNGQIMIFNLANQRLECLSIFKHAIKSLSLDNETLFTVSADAKAAFVDMKTLHINNLGVCHDKIANGCAAISGAYYSVSRDLFIRRFSHFDIDFTLKSVHKNSIKCIATCDNGEFIATGSYAGEVAVYQCEPLGLTLVEAFRPTRWGISALAYDVNNHRFVASSYDGNIYPINKSK